MIESLICGVDLSETEAEASLEFLLNEANEILISAFLVLLRAKGETFEEVTTSRYFAFVACFHVMHSMPYHYKQLTWRL